MKCEPAFLEWTVHIKAVQQARELTAAVGCLTSTECFPIAEAVLEGVAGKAFNSISIIDVRCSSHGYVHL